MPFDIRDSRNETWTLSDIATCEAATRLNAEAINDVVTALIDLDPNVQDRFSSTKREALLTYGAITLLLNEMALRDEGKVVEKARATASAEAQKTKSEITDLIKTIQTKRDTDPKAAKMATVTLEYSLSLRDIQTHGCSQTLIIMTPAHTLLEAKMGSIPTSPPTDTPLAPEPAAEPVPALAKSASKWRVRIDKSEMTDETLVLVMTTSEEIVPSNTGSSEHGTLILRCSENVTSAFIHFGGAFMSDIQGYGSVDVRVDDQKMRIENMDASDNNEALGLFSGGSAIPFIKNLFDGEILRIRATPYNDNYVLLTFPIEGLAEEITPLREACGWERRSPPQSGMPCRPCRGRLKGSGPSQRNWRMRGRGCELRNHDS
jgi:type VI secretion system protein VasI